MACHLCYTVLDSQCRVVEIVGSTDLERGRESQPVTIASLDLDGGVLDRTSRDGLGLLEVEESGCRLSHLLVPYHDQVSALSTVKPDTDGPEERGSLKFSPAVMLTIFSSRQLNAKDERRRRVVSKLCRMYIPRLLLTWINHTSEA
jgi:hypothetical protein